MKSIALQVILCFGLLVNVFAQSCLPDTLVLTSQQEIDAFPMDYPDCTFVLGSLVISANDLSNLNGLNQIDTIGGYLSFDNNSFTELTGLALPNLKEVRGYIVIQNNNALTSLNGIVPWLELADSLIIDNNASLTNLSGLESQTNLSGFYQISNNLSLSNLSGLDNVSSFSGSLHIESNTSLTSLDGLQSISSFNGDLELNFNTALNNLDALSNLTSLGGDLYFRGCLSLTTLSALQNLTEIDGDLGIIDCDGLINLEGLNNLTTIDDLFFRRNNALESLSALSNLVTIQGDLDLSNNIALTSLDGLEGLTSIPDDVLLDSLPSLTSMTGLGNLISIGGGLKFKQLPVIITDLTAFSNLISIGDYLSIRLTALVSVAGLENITTLGGRIFIHNNDSLADLTPLQNLTSINGELVIKWGDMLASLDGLHNIDPSGITFLELIGNDSLEFCNQANICTYLANGGPADIEGNKVGCVNVIDILGVCFPIDPIVSGKVYFDGNGDCIDNGEDGAEDVIIRFSNTNFDLYTTTDNTGFYNLALVPGEYEVTVINFSLDCWNICNSPTLLTVDENDVVTLDFGLEAIVQCPKLTVDVGANTLLPCVPTIYEINYCNKGTITAEGSEIAFTLGENFTFIGSSPILPFAVDGATYRFDIGDVPANFCGSINVTAIYDADCNSFVEGQTACVEAHIFPDSLCQPPSPDWDGSSLKVSAICDGDSIRFTIENVGAFPMSSSSNYIVIEDNIMMRTGNVNLAPGDTLQEVVTASGSTFRLQLEQTENHPGVSRPSVTIEGCDPDGDNEYSIGFFLQWPQDDANDFQDIECMEVMETEYSNSKSTDPLGIEEMHCLLNEIPLEYVIHFQNTGGDTVHQVIVQDSISQLLDIGTIQAGSASHPYDFEMISTGIAQFTFSDIALPDSSTNAIGSHGFVSFKIWQKEANAVGSLIRNNSIILFDSLNQVKTNTVYHTIAEGYCIDTVLLVDGITMIPTDQPVLKVYPNPLEAFTIFELADYYKYPSATISIYDMTGRTVSQFPLTQQQTVFNRSALPAGIYVYQLHALGYPILAHGKLVLF